MKTTTLTLLFAFGFLIQTNLYAVVTAPKVAPEIAVPVSDFSKAELENLLGRKVKVAEWLAFKVSNKKSHKNIKHYHERGEGRGFGLAGFILGILGLVTFNFLFALLGVIFSTIALGRMRRSGYYGERGFAITGLTLGIIGLVATLVVVGIALVVIL